MIKQLTPLSLLLLSSLCFAVPITVEFGQDLGVNGFVEGSFTGEDVDLDGVINFDVSVAGLDTVSDYILTFTPGTANSGDINPFTLGLAMLDRLLFADGGLSVVVIGGEDPGPGSLEHFYNCNSLTECFVGDINDIYGGGGNTVTAVTQVPEPGTLTLFGLGLLGIGFARRKTA